MTFDVIDLTFGLFFFIAIIVLAAAIWGTQPRGDE